ncbi:unnamed protein product, partial [Urochloa humidicola]
QPLTSGPTFLHLGPTVSDSWQTPPVTKIPPHVPLTPPSGLPIAASSAATHPPDMGTAGKPPPFVCLKWPWNPNPEPSPSPSPCGDLELPWLFKSIRTLAQGLVIAGDLPSPPASASGGGGGRKRRGWGSGGAAQVEADRGDAEQRALAAALAGGRPATVLEFYSPRCRLCGSLQELVRELEEQAGGSAGFVLADAEDDRWLPERRRGLQWRICFCITISDTSRALCSWTSTAEL